MISSCCTVGRVNHTVEEHPRNLTIPNPDQLSQVSTPARRAGNQTLPSEAEPPCSSVRGGASLE